jgi:hypothetical protein
MRPKTSPLDMSGAHITEHSLRFTTEEELDHSSSWRASATTSGRRVRTTFWTMESEIRETASSMEERARLRAARTTVSPPSSRTRKPLSARVSSSRPSSSSSRRRSRSLADSRRSEKRTSAWTASRGSADPVAGTAAAPPASPSRSSVAPTRTTSPGARRQAERRRPFTRMSTPSCAVAS